MIRLDRVSKIFPQGEILKSVTWELKAGDRVGLVGANGAGKTTVFRMIAAQMEPTSGEIIRQSGTQVAYLTQEFELRQDYTVREELSRAFVECNEITEALHDVHLK